MRTVSYNSRQRMIQIVLCPRRSAEIAVWMLLSAGVALAATTTTAVQLAAQIAEVAGSATVHLSYRNVGSLTSAEFQDFTRDLENSLRARGVRLVTSNAGVDVTVTASENLRGPVFVAQTQQGRDTRTIVVAAPQDTAAGGQGGPPVTLRRTLLVEQDEPVLDALALDGGTQLATLGPSRATVYKRNADRWEPQSSYEFQAARAWPADIRGRLVPATDHAFDAYLPGMVCATQTLTPLVMSCRTTDDPWPIGERQSAFYNAARNYFNGVISPGIGAGVEPFYTIMALPRTTGTVWLMTGVDGRIRIADGKDTATLTLNPAARDWGSDIAAVNGCGRGPLIIAAGPGDGTAPDTLRAYDMPDREPVAASSALEMTGPVTALWMQSDQRSAVAVVHSLTTGKYDAYAVSVTCNQ